MSRKYPDLDRLYLAAPAFLDEWGDVVSEVFPDWEPPEYDFWVSYEERLSQVGLKPLKGVRR